jgi:hypothetical protein
MALTDIIADPCSELTMKLNVSHSGSLLDIIASPLVQVDPTIKIYAIHTGSLLDIIRSPLAETDGTMKIAVVHTGILTDIINVPGWISTIKLFLAGVQNIILNLTNGNLMSRISDTIYNEL